MAHSWRIWINSWLFAGSLTCRSSRKPGSNGGQQWNRPAQRAINREAIRLAVQLWPPGATESGSPDRPPAHLDRAGGSGGGVNLGSRQIEVAQPFLTIHLSRLSVVQQHALPQSSADRATPSGKQRESAHTTKYSKSTLTRTFLTFPWYQNRPREDSQAENASSILVARSLRSSSSAPQNNLRSPWRPKIGSVGRFAVVAGNGWVNRQ
jgi:hypothetical protein